MVVLVYTDATLEYWERNHLPRAYEVMITEEKLQSGLASEKDED